MEVVEVGVPSTTKHYVFSSCIIFKPCYGNCNVILTTAYFELQNFLQLNVQIFRRISVVFWETYGNDFLVFITF